VLIKINDIKKRVEEKYGVLENGKFYDATDFGMSVESPNGTVQIKSFVAKTGKKVSVVLETGETVDCSDSHKFVNRGLTKRAGELRVGDLIDTRNGETAVKSIEISEESGEFFDIEVSGDHHLFYTANGVVHHNTGKTFTIEEELKSAGKTDGDGYFKITGTASAIGIYKMLYQHRNDIILVDDCDDAFVSQEARNLFKAATDTKKVRKIAWMKKAGKDFYNPDTDDVPEDDGEGGEDAMVPTYFDFKGRVIAITNLNLDSLDKDGAFRTRSFMVNIDPTDMELVEFMSKLAPSVELEDGLTMSKDDRVDTAMFLRTMKLKSNLSLRTLVRALNIRASGIENWKDIVARYA